MAIINPVSYMQNRADHSAQTDRLAISGLTLPAGAVNTWRGGVRGPNDLKVAQQNTPNMSVKISGGQGCVPISTSLNGLYSVLNDGDVSLAIGTAHATLPRNDLVILRVVDSFFAGGSDNEGKLEVISGSAASTPSDPAVTGSYILLARVVVPGGASSISNSDIVDLRPRLAAVGGILHINTNAERTALTPFEGMMIYYLPDKIHQAYIDGNWESIGGGSGGLIKKRVMRMTSNQSVNSAATATIGNWADYSASTDDDELMTHASGVWTIIVPGQYLWTGSFQLAGGGSGSWSITLQHSSDGGSVWNDILRRQKSQTSDYQSIHIECDLLMAVGDKVRFAVTNNTGGTRNLYGSTTSPDRSVMSSRFDGTPA